MNAGGRHLPRVRQPPRKSKIFFRQSRAVRLQPAVRILGMGRNKEERMLDFHKSWDSFLPRLEPAALSVAGAHGRYHCPPPLFHSFSSHGRSPWEIPHLLVRRHNSLPSLPLPTSPLIFLKIFFTPNSKVSEATSGSANKVILLEVCPASAEPVLRWGGLASGLACGR